MGTTLMSTLIERLTILDGELRHHRARPKHFSMAPYVVAKDLGENTQFLQPPVKRLVTLPDLPLHCQICNGVDVVFWTFDLVSVSAVTIVGLDSFVQLEDVHQYQCQATCRQGRGLGSKPVCRQGCQRQARSGGQTYLLTCGSRRRSPSLLFLFLECGSQCLRPT